MTTVVGRHFSTCEDGRVRCNVCPRHCQLREGKRGFCFVRKNENNQIVLTTYNRSSGFCIDPIEKKPLNHFYPGTPVLSFGTAGCNLGCQFCQNWDISKAKEMDKLQQEAIPTQIAQMAKATGCNSVAFTYNDPIIFLEYATDVAIACHDQGLKTVTVSSGYMTPESRKDLYQHIDATNIDLKAFSETFYEKLCFAQLGPVLDTLSYLKNETDVWLEITTLLIPGENDSDKEVHQLTQWISENLGPDTPLHFTAFHPDFKMQNKSATPQKTLTKARNIALENGLHFVYTGNVHDPEGSSTYCPNCKKRLIERDWYQLGEYKIKENRCLYCTAPIPGVFLDTPGNWGPKRQALSFK